MMAQKQMFDRDMLVFQRSGEILGGNQHPRRKALGRVDLCGFHLAPTPRQTLDGIAHTARQVLCGHVHAGSEAAGSGLLVIQQCRKKVNHIDLDVAVFHGQLLRFLQAACDFWVSF